MTPAASDVDEDLALARLRVGHVGGTSTSGPPWACTRTARIVAPLAIGDEERMPYETDNAGAATAPPGRAAGTEAGSVVAAHSHAAAAVVSIAPSTCSADEHLGHAEGVLHAADHALRERHQHEDPEPHDDRPWRPHGVQQEAQPDQQAQEREQQVRVGRGELGDGERGEAGRRGVAGVRARGGHEGPDDEQRPQHRRRSPRSARGPAAPRW